MSNRQLLIIIIVVVIVVVVVVVVVVMTVITIVAINLHHLLKGMGLILRARHSIMQWGRKEHL